MNSKQFLIASMVFLIEARKYDIAAQYLLHDARNNNGKNNQTGASQPTRKKLIREIKRLHESILKQYPKRLTIEQMREIAREVYEQVYSSMLPDKCENTPVYNENLNAY